MCTRDHDTKSCTRSKSAFQFCINCADVYVKKKKETIPTYNKKDIRKEDMAVLDHSAHAAACPVRQSLSVPNKSRDFFPVTKHDTQSHVVH